MFLPAVNNAASKIFLLDITVRMNHPSLNKFLPRDAMLSAVYAVVVCLSVCLCVCVSVTLLYCIKTAKRKITQTTPHDSAGTL